MRLSLCSISNLSVASDDSQVTLKDALQPMKDHFEFSSIERNDIVTLSAVENVNCVWVRAVKYDELYEELLSKNNVNISTLPVDDIERNSVLLVKHCDDYSRAIVVDVNSCVTVQLMDIGNKVNVKRGKQISFWSFVSKF